MKPVPVERVLLLAVKRERRKAFVAAKLSDPFGNENVEGGTVVHAEADGLIVLNRGVLPGL